MTIYTKKIMTVLLLQSMQPASWSVWTWTAFSLREGRAGGYQLLVITS